MPNELTTDVTPSHLLQMALSSGADLDRLERLMVMKERWDALEAERAYNKAFVAFKSEAIVVIKNKAVTDGPLKGKSYAELFSVVNAVTPLLSKHGLSAAWKLSKDEKDWIEVTVTLKHLLGHTESVAMGGPPDTGGAKNAIQARASTISYLERYTLKAICGIAEQGEDDDGRGGAKDKEEKLEPPEALLKAAHKAAAGGKEAYERFWSGTGKANRHLLGGHHESLKIEALEADQKALATTAPPADPWGDALGTKS